MTVIGHRMLLDEIARINGFNQPIMAARGAYQFETTGIEGYGSVAHSAPRIHTWYLGYRTGEVTDFDPPPYLRRQRGYVAAMGGAERVKSLARQAMADGDDRWAIELLGYLVRSDPSDTEARRLDAQAHRRECVKKATATWRNWYLAAARELEGDIPLDAGSSTRDILMGLPLASIVAGLPMRLRAELTWYVERTIGLTVGSAEAGTFTLQLRRWILDVRPGADDEVDATMALADKAALADYLGGATVAELVEAGRLEVRGDTELVPVFASYFDEPASTGRILMTLHGPAERR